MSASVTRILLVDDEPRILDGLRRQLRAYRAQWQCAFAGGGEEALAMLKEGHWDVIISDMKMPGMNGGQLLEKVWQLYPHMVRIILSGQTDQSELLQCLGFIHQYLQKPCDPKTLCAAIERTHGIVSSLSQPSLRAAAGQVRALPPGSQTYRDLIEALTRGAFDVKRVSALAEADPAITAKLMQLVQSSFFGLPRKIANCQEAVGLLGAQRVHAVVVSSRLFDALTSDLTHEPNVTRLWDHCVEVGTVAGMLAYLDGADTQVQEHARLAGCLCLIGRVILLRSSGALYLQAVHEARSRAGGVLEAESRCFGATQDAIAAYALGIWAFPEAVVEAVAYQSAPSLLPKGKVNPVLKYLHASRGVMCPGDTDLGEQLAIDMQFLKESCEEPQPQRSAA